MFIPAPRKSSSARRVTHAYLFNTIQKGFTLLEIMVVVAIIGILFSLAALSISTGGDKSLEAEAKQFAALMKLAGEEAIINSQEMVLEVNKHEYSFMVLGDGGFAPVEGAGAVFRPRELPEYLEIKLVIEDQPIDLENVTKENQPKIGIFSSGEMTPFAITFVREDGLAFGVDGDFFGNVKYLGKLKEGEF